MVFVVSLRTAIRRRRLVSEMLKGMGMRFTFIDAIDGDDASAVGADFACRETTADRNYIHRSKPITARELACSLSHIRAIKAASAVASQRALIVEDDVDFLCRDPMVLARLAQVAPSDAAYLQLQVASSATIEALHARYLSSGALYERKKRSPPYAFTDPALSAFTCHGTAAYIVTLAGMKNLLGRVLPDDRFLFPCKAAEVSSNKALVSDKLVYWAATNEHCHGYAIRAPVATTSAVDSYLHKDHVTNHRRAREAAISIFGECLAASSSADLRP